MMDTDKRRNLSLVVIVVGFLLFENSFIAENSHPRLRQLVRNIYASDLDTQKQKEAVEAITQMGPSIVPELIRLTEDTDKDVRAGAILAIGIFPQAARAAIPDLINTLNQKDEGLKMVAASTLGSMGPAASAAVPHLINILKDTNLRKSGSSAIYYAAEALGEIGPDAKSAVPALKEIRNDRRISSATQSEASFSIHLIERRDPDPRVRAAAARGLRGTLRPKVVAILR